MNMVGPGYGMAHWVREPIGSGRQPRAGRGIQPTEDAEAAAMHTESTSSHSAEPAPAPATDAWAGWHGSGSAYYDYSWKTWSYDN